MGFTYCHQARPSNSWINIVLAYLAPCCILSGYSGQVSILVLDRAARKRSTLSGYLVTAPNLIGHGSRVATDYRLSSFAEDLRPYLAARNYSLIIGHSLGALTTLALFSHLSPSHPTAIVLVDPPMQVAAESIPFFNSIFSDSCVNVKPADAHEVENLLWTREDSIYRELGTRLCSVEGVNALFQVRLSVVRTVLVQVDTLQQNKPWSFSDYLNAISKKWKVTALVADPAFYKICPVEDIHPYPHVRPVMVSGAGHWIQYEFPEVIVDEALKTVAELEIA